MKDKYINIEFSYNGNLGKLQQKTIDNKVFCDRLLQNEIISYDEYRDLMEKIHNYFVTEIARVMKYPNEYIDTLGA